MIHRSLVVGGFEVSGHDAQAEALVEAGRARGHEVDVLHWRDLVDITTHPMFESHRYAAAHGCSDVAGVLDEPWIAPLLARELAGSLPNGYGAYLSVHPWSSVICARAVSDRRSSAIVVDHYGEFSAFPAVTDPRIDAYIGAGAVRSVEPRIRARCHSLGVVVARRFHAIDTDQRRRRLLVSAGSDGWAVRAMASATRTLADAIAPDELVLLAPTDEAAVAWAGGGFGSAEMLRGVNDIAPLLRSSTWYLSKGGGNAVAEGLAAGCEGYVCPSGIFWEDEGAYRLAAQGALRLVTDEKVLGAHDPMMVERERQRALGAADQVWALVESRKFFRHDHAEATVLDHLLASASAVETLLPSVTSRLVERLAAWRAGWEEGA